MTAELGRQIRELIDANARPIPLSEITARARSPVPPCRPGLVRPKVRLGLSAAVVAGAVAAGCVGAITFGRLTAPGHLAGHPARPAGAVLTNAQVRRMTVASRAALAHSARAYLSYGGPSPYDTFGVADIAFSGADYSLAGSVINPAASDRPGQVAWFTDRVVNGQAYAHERDSEGWHWFHYARPAGGRPAHILDPRVMLSVLAPVSELRPGTFARSVASSRTSGTPQATTCPAIRNRSPGARTLSITRGSRMRAGRPPAGRA